LTQTPEPAPLLLPVDPLDELELLEPEELEEEPEDPEDDEPLLELLEVEELEDVEPEDEEVEAEVEAVDEPVEPIDDEPEDELVELLELFDELLVDVLDEELDEEPDEELDEDDPELEEAEDPELLDPLEDDEEDVDPFRLEAELVFEAGEEVAELVGPPAPPLHAARDTNAAATVHFMAAPLGRAQVVPRADPRIAGSAIFQKAMRLSAAACVVLTWIACAASKGGLDAGPPDGGRDAGPADAGTTPSLALALHRTDGAILAVIIATDENGAAVSGLSVAVDTPSSSVTAVEDGGAYLATIVPPFTSGELPLWAHLVGSDGGPTRTALVLPFVGAQWDQPEPVAGLVNTPGTEDSATVSPDGQWLIVGTYSPVDLLSCDGTFDGYPLLDGNNPACSTALGPIAAPDRPGMPGAERVLSPTEIDFAIPSMCAAEPDGGPVIVPGPDGGLYPFALPPTAVYGFHRQADGSYAEPFLIDFAGADGFISQPFCFSFLGTGAPGGAVPVIFAYNLDSPSDPKPHPWSTQLVLGQPDSLGSYACGAPLPGYPTFTPEGITPLPVGPAGQQAGNTSVANVAGGEYLLSDDESANPPYVEFSLADGGGGYSDWVPAALPQPTLDQRQPVYFGGRLYYYRAMDVASVAWAGGDPADAGSFSDLQTELAHDTNPSEGAGEVVAVGQPTLALVDGGAELFFVYYRRTDGGFNGQVGRVPAW
jgi:hypothetical protein